MEYKRSFHVASLSPVQCAAWAPDPRKVEWVSINGLFLIQCCVLIASDSTYIMSSVFQDIFIVTNSSNHGFVTQWFVYSKSIDFVRGIILFGGVGSASN
jgi:hypothetical protein